MQKLRVSAVSYLNTKPFLHGIEITGLQEQMELSLDVPAVSAQKLFKGKVDLALVPVALLPRLDNPKIITNYCIGANKRVDSVSLFSQVPMQEVTSVIVDKQSLTSANLTRILLKEYWNKNIELKKSFEGYENQITGNTAGLVIGDRALRLRNNYNYCYDLASEWHKHTQLPFVFAVWVAANSFAASFEDELNTAFAKGLEEIEAISAFYSVPYKGIIDPLHYFSQSISYTLDKEKWKALDLFLEKISATRDFSSKI